MGGGVECSVACIRYRFAGKGFAMNLSLRNMLEISVP